MSTADGDSGAGGDSRLAELRVPARAERLAIVRATVRAALDHPDWVAVRDDVVLAVDEACQNVIRHAYGADGGGDLEVHLTTGPDRLVIDVRDFAPPVDPDRVAGRDLDDVQPGGLGVNLIRSVMDEARFLPPPAGGGNLFRMTRYHQAMGRERQ